VPHLFAFMHGRSQA